MNNLKDLNENVLGANIIRPFSILPGDFSTLAGCTGLD